MKKIISILFVTLIMLPTFSCSDFLDLNPTNQPSEETFWKTEADFNMALAGIYGQVRSQNTFNALYPLLDNLSDNSYDKNGEGGAQNICRGEVTPSSWGYIPDIFSFCYKVLSRTNLFIEQVENSSSLSDDSKERFMAEGKFFRAYFYTWLYLLYGDVPLVLNPLTLDEQYLPKEDAEIVYAQILADYDSAIKALPDVTYKEGNGHITREAVMAFKAKLILQHAYDKGVPNKEELKDVLRLLESIKGYSLQPEYSDLFKTETQEDSPEIMFSIKNLAPSSCTALDMYYTNWMHACPLRNLVDEFEIEGEGEWLGSPNAALINEDLINNPKVPVEEQEKERAKLFENRDKRLKATIFHSLKPFPHIRYIVGETDYTGFGCFKYLQDPVIKGDLFDGEQSEQDMIHMRYGYVLLMIAEAENEVNGPTEKVYQAVNQIRQRAGQKELPRGLSQIEMRKKIRHEWRVETAMEGLRYLEMKRWHTLGDIVNIQDPKFTDYKPKFEERFYLWPLPQGEIDKAQGVLVQNPDYN